MHSNGIVSVVEHGSGQTRSQPVLQIASLWFSKYVLETISKIVKVGNFLNPKV
jgi:hypothetical protein